MDEQQSGGTPQIEDVDCPCGGVMLPNPGNKWVCSECGRSGEFTWRWHDAE